MCGVFVFFIFEDFFIDYYLVSYGCDDLWIIVCRYFFIIFKYCNVMWGGKGFRYIRFFDFFMYLG